MNNKALKQFIPLNHKISIYVPSTININETIDNSEYINETASRLTAVCGGATITSALGFWHSETVGNVTEKVNIIFAYVNNESFEKAIKETLSIANYLKSNLKQDAISLEIDNKMYFV